MRLFVGINLNRDLKEKIRNIEDQLVSDDVKIKIVELENLHITLKFLGEVDDSNVKDVTDRLSDALKSSPQFKAELEGVGYFGKPSYVKTLWIGVKEGKEQLMKLMQKINRSLDYIKKENHESSPHITLGRVKQVKDKKSFIKKLEELNDIKVGELLVKDVALKRSILTPEGPFYEDVKVFALKGEEGE